MDFCVRFKLRMSQSGEENESALYISTSASTKPSKERCYAGEFSSFRLIIILAYNFRLQALIKPLLVYQHPKLFAGQDKLLKVA